MTTFFSTSRDDTISRRRPLTPRTMKPTQLKAVNPCYDMPFASPAMTVALVAVACVLMPQHRYGGDGTTTIHPATNSVSKSMAIRPHADGHRAQRRYDRLSADRPSTRGRKDARASGGALDDRLLKYVRHPVVTLPSRNSRSRTSWCSATSRTPASTSCVPMLACPMRLRRPAV